MGSQEKAAIIKAAAILGAGLLAAWYVKKQAQDMAGAVGDALTQAWDYVSDVSAQALGAVWSAENMVSAGAGSAGVTSWAGNRDTMPLILYFQQHGNTAATRAEARRKGWTAGEISAAVAAMGHINGYY